MSSSRTFGGLQRGDPLTLLSLEGVYIAHINVGHSDSSILAHP